MNSVYKFPSMDTEFKDGDGGNTSSDVVIIESVENGYIITVTSDDEDVRMVFTDKKELLKHLGIVL